jgi:hypothetical protein
MFYFLILINFFINFRVTFLSSRAIYTFLQTKIYTYNKLILTYELTYTAPHGGPVAHVSPLAPLVLVFDCRTTCRAGFCTLPTGSHYHHSSVAAIREGPSRTTPGELPVPTFASVVLLQKETKTPEMKQDKEDTKSCPSPKRPVS